MEMIWVNPGTFMMGSPANERGRAIGLEEFQHRVTLTKGFYMGKYEVTQAQWEIVMGASKNLSRTKGASLPITGVHWRDIVRFISKLNDMERKAGTLPLDKIYSLPTEAQWEYACRAGTTSAYAVIGQPQSPISEVGKFPANRWGFHDMNGNVRELCSGLFVPYPRSAVTDPSFGLKRWDKSSQYRVARGGRSAERHKQSQYGTSDSLGFRIVYQ